MGGLRRIINLLVNSLTYRRLTHPTHEFYRGLDDDNFSLSLGILIERTLLFSQGDKMSNFEELKASLPRRWLDYYQNNQAWIKCLMNSRGSWRKTPDGGKRPSADIIIAAATALEPKLSVWMYPFCQLSSDGDKLVEVLGLNFDSEKKELEKSEKELLMSNSHTEYLNGFREKQLSVEKNKVIIFEELLKILPDKWLDYYQNNQPWIKSLMDSKDSWRKTPDGGKRPSADIIIGAITVLESQLSVWMYPFCQLSSDGNKLLEVLGLNFDPEKKRLEKKERELSNSLYPTEDPVLQKIRQELQQENLNKPS